MNLEKSYVDLPKIAFGMIVFEGDYVLKECLESVYPYATQILIAEGPVKYWQEQGRTTSLDETNKILKDFPDPDNKIKVVHGTYTEKDEQCNSYMKHLREDIDYVWNLDSDEVYKKDDIEKLLHILKTEKYTSVGVRSCTFYGGFDRVVSGFEEKKDNFLRIFKVYPGSIWETHRPPTVTHPSDIKTLPEKHLDSDTLFFRYNIQMYHYSYVFPRQVCNKIQYYQAKVSKDNCLDYYIEDVYLPWISGDNSQKYSIESLFLGVHEFRPSIRGKAFTKKFLGNHPSSILRSMDAFSLRLQKETEFLKETILQQKIQRKNSVFWNNTDSNHSKEMLAGANGEKWPVLEKSDHWPTLGNLINQISPKVHSVLDLGCGAAELGNLVKKYWPHIEYSGADLPAVIDKVAKIQNPNMDLLEFDIESDDLSFLSKHDLVVMNAFIDVMHNPYTILSKVLQSHPKFVILHRQNISTKTYSEIVKCSYDDSNSFQSTLAHDDINELAQKNGYNLFGAYNNPQQTNVTLVFADKNIV